MRNAIVNELYKEGVNLGNRELDQLLVFISLLKKWSRTINLTALKDDLLIVQKLILPSLKFSTMIDINCNGKILDLGTGGGFPGIPLKVAFPCLNITLLDSSSKKTAFLKSIIPVLALSNIRCINERCEIFSNSVEEKESYKHVLAMAVASLSKLIELAFPLLVEGGTLITLKGNLLDKEIIEAEAEHKGFKIKKIEEVNQTDNCFTLVSIIKCFT